MLTCFFTKTCIRTSIETSQTTLAAYSIQITDKNICVSRDGAVSVCGLAADSLLRVAQSLEGVAGEQL